MAMQPISHYTRLTNFFQGSSSQESHVSMPLELPEHNELHDLTTQRLTNTSLTNSPLSDDNELQALTSQISIIDCCNLTDQRAVEEIEAYLNPRTCGARFIDQYWKRVVSVGCGYINPAQRTLNAAKDLLENPPQIMIDAMTSWTHLDQTLQKHGSPPITFQNVVQYAKAIESDQMISKEGGLKPLPEEVTLELTSFLETSFVVTYPITYHPLAQEARSELTSFLETSFDKLLLQTGKGTIDRVPCSSISIAAHMLKIWKHAIDIVTSDFTDVKIRAVIARSINNLLSKSADPQLLRNFALTVWVKDDADMGQTQFLHEVSQEFLTAVDKLPDVSADNDYFEALERPRLARLTLAFNNLSKALNKRALQICAITPRKEANTSVIVQQFFDQLQNVPDFEEMLSIAQEAHDIYHKKANQINADLNEDTDHINAHESEQIHARKEKLHRSKTEYHQLCLKNEDL